MNNTKTTKRDLRKFNVFLFVSTFARSLIEIFISLYLFKNGFSIHSILEFYLIENIFSFFISILFVKVGERFNYSIVMYFGVVSFIILQLVLGNPINNFPYILLISFLYAMYRRGYWVARRFYVTKIMPEHNSSIPYSIVMAVSEVASIVSGFVGSFLLDNLNIVALTVISSVLLFISVLPLAKIESTGTHSKDTLLKSLKKFDKKNYVAFSLYEINNLLTYLFPIYVFLFIKDTYAMAGTINAVSSLAIIFFVLFYGRLIKNRNFFVLSSVLFILVSFTKLFFLNYFILALAFVEGIIKKMQNQSLGKIYFENRNGIDLSHYNLIYQLTEAVARVVATVPLFFMSDVRAMIIVVLAIISVLLIFYNFAPNNKR